MQYVGQNVWQPESHTYKSVIEPATDDSGLIKVYNNKDAGSNIPVKASVNVDVNNSTNSYGIVGKLEDGSTSEVNETIDVGKDLTRKLSLNTDQLVNFDTNITATVGTVSVTLKDYRKE